MALLRIGSSGKSYLLPRSFESEHELHAVLAENPRLLVADGAAPPVVVCRHLSLAAADGPLLLIDLESVPIVVETELAGSSDRRTTLVARALDDISALAQLTAERLDEAAGGSVGSALRDIAGGDRYDFDRRWEALAANLRAARIRLILVVDELGPDLDRMVRFLAERTSLEVQCVALAKSRGPNGDTYYAPAMLLDENRIVPPAPVTSAPAVLRLVGSGFLKNRTFGDHAWRSSPRGAFDARRLDLGRVRWDG